MFIIECNTLWATAVCSPLIFKTLQCVGQVTSGRCLWSQWSSVHLHPHSGSAKVCHGSCRAGSDLRMKHDCTSLPNLFLSWLRKSGVHSVHPHRWDARAERTGAEVWGMLAGPSAGWIRAETSPSLHPWPARPCWASPLPPPAAALRGRAAPAPICARLVRDALGGAAAGGSCPALLFSSLPFPSRPFPPRWRRRCRGPAGGQPAPLLRSAPLRSEHRGMAGVSAGRGSGLRVSLGAAPGASGAGSEPLPLAAERCWRCPARARRGRERGRGAAGSEPRVAPSSSECRQVPGALRDAAIRIHRHALA